VLSRKSLADIANDGLNLVSMPAAEPDPQMTGDIQRFARELILVGRRN